MKSSLVTYTLLFKKPFQLAHGIRTGSDALYLLLEKNGITGYSEATFPPYLSETVSLAIQDLEEINFDEFQLPQNNIYTLLAPLVQYKISPFSRSLICNALLDLNAKLRNISLIEMLGLNDSDNYKSCITITKSDLSSLEEKKEMARSFSCIKLKLDGKNDMSFVNMICSTIQKPFCVDVNQGWEKMEWQQVLKQTTELKRLGCELIEQPFLRSNYTKHKLLKEEKILDVYADESIQDITEFNAHADSFDGINIKILKCGGIDKALELAIKAKTASKKIIIGCMSESSCGCATAFALHSFANYMDIDGPWLIQNDPFNGLKINNGKFELTHSTGTGIELTNGFKQ